MGSTKVRVHDSTKEQLERLGGEDYTIDDVIRILLDDFIEPDEDDDRDQLSLFDFDDDEEGGEL